MKYYNFNMFRNITNRMYNINVQYSIEKYFQKMEALKSLNHYFSASIL